MDSFIRKLTSAVFEKHGKELNKLCIVFPTRRAALFFREELSKQLDGPVWSPALYSIQDFILKMNTFLLPDPLTLQFELFKVYKKYFPNEEFDRFYPWGELLLKDFNDIDNYLADADKIFATVRSLQQIDAEFTLEDEDMERLKLFWSNFFDQDPTRLKNEFLNTWKHLHSVYSDFKKVLRQKNWAYDGMAYKEICNRLPESSIVFQEDFDKVIFAGFYALSPSEDYIIRYFFKEKNAEIFYDADPYYTDDHGQEAGKFFRNSNLHSDDYKWKEDHFGKNKKEITFTGVPLLIGQAKYAGQQLIDVIKRDDYVPERTAVVLPDEKLLLPVLYALPKEIESINVTMGYPLRLTPLYDLFESLVALQLNSRLEDSDHSFFYRDVKNILNHPYVRILCDNSVRKWMHSAKDNFIRIGRKSLLAAVNDPLFSKLFIVPDTIQEVFEWMIDLLRQILAGMSDEESGFHRLETEFVFHFYTHLKRLEDIFKVNDVEVSVSVFRKIFREIISSVRIPFSGEPLKGLQVMGYLETRVLDFDRIILLSVNENTLPASGNQPSFIPFNVRKAFGLPTYEEQHAVSAYHFYRLLQRAKHVELVYNTEPSGDVTGREPSRFLLQIENELVRKFPDTISLKKKIITTPLQKKDQKPIVIEKTSGLMAELENFRSSADKKATRSLSASGLQSYISCSLKFYFRYIAGLKETEEKEETMEAKTIGLILHKAMETLYADVSILDKKAIERKRLDVEQAVDSAIEYYFAQIHHLEGKNRLLRNILIQLVHRIFNLELLYDSATILKLEKDVSSPFKVNDSISVVLYGIIDRLDEVKGVKRIIDYKTGRVKIKKELNIESLFTSTDQKEQFQTMYYAYLTSMHEASDARLVSGLIVLREMSEGIQFMNDGAPFTQKQYSEFSEHLSKLISAIFDPSIPFTQTDDVKNCTYCAYKEICNR